MLEPVAAGDGSPRGLLRLGPATLVRQQLGVLLALECQRIVCIAREIVPDLIARHHDAERAGAQFHVIPGPRGLLGLVSAQDEVIAIADGLLAPPEAVRALLEVGPAVLVQPVEAGLGAGFERIDLNHAAAGAMRIPGQLVERLADLPPDCDAASALTRVALQGGVHQRPVSQAEGSAWWLLRSEDEAHAAEQQWIAEAARGGGAPTPGSVLVRLLVRGFGPALLHAGTSSTTIVAFSALLLFLALGAVWFGHAALALALAGLGWVAGRVARSLRAVERHLLSLGLERPTRDWLLGVAYDLALVAILIRGVPVEPGEGIVDRAFAPLMLVGVLRLVPRALPRDVAQWFSDRLVPTWALAGAAVAGLLETAVQGLAFVLVVSGIALADRAVRLTRP